MSTAYPLRLASMIDPTIQSSTFAQENERLSGTTTPSSTLSSAFNDQAAELVIRYFDDFGSIVPVIHRPSFLERFELARNGNSGAGEQSWLALLNIVLALAFVDISGSTATNHDPTLQANAHQEISQRVLEDSSLHDLNLDLGNQTYCR